MNKRQQRQWDRLGASDPYWAVLTRPGTRGGRWDKEKFFASGEKEIRRVLKRAKRFGLSINQNTALDYGCGVGRLSRALATRFEQVVGVDMSGSMLEEARRNNPDQNHLRFVQNSGNDLALVEDASVDFIYSNIVLQHSSPASQRAVIREFCRVLRPGGALAFQTPSHHNWRHPKSFLHRLLGNRLLNMLRRFKYGRDGLMEIHTLKRKEVERLLAEQGMELVKADRHDSAGRLFVSYMYYARKRG